MKHVEWNNEELTLRVKRAPVLILVFFYLFSFLTFLAPIAGLVYSIHSGGGVHLGFFVAIGLFGLLGFYMLRVSLWNSYGSEKIKFGNEVVTYQADYGWFKGEIKEESRATALDFSFYSIGYEDEGKGSLKIELGEKTIECATKMPKEVVYEVISNLKSRVN